MKSRFCKEIKNSKGQGTVELILLLVVSLSILSFISSEAKKRNWLPNLIGKPFVLVSGMLEGGHWEEPKKIRQENLHPHANTSTRDPND